jgi:hypothetical protein
MRIGAVIACALAAGSVVWLAEASGERPDRLFEHEQLVRRLIVDRRGLHVEPIRQYLARRLVKNDLLDRGLAYDSVGVQRTWAEVGPAAIERTRRRG